MENTLIDFSKYDRADLRCILNELKKHSEPVYTHKFEFTEPRNYSFIGRPNRPYLRSLLRYLESLGIVENFDLGSNIHKWKITEKGREFDF